MSNSALTGRRILHRARMSEEIKAKGLGQDLSPQGCCRGLIWQLPGSCLSTAEPPTSQSSLARPELGLVLCGTAY